MNGQESLSFRSSLMDGTLQHRSARQYVADADDAGFITGFESRIGTIHLPCHA
jgi:hypothetical protein